MRSRRRGRSQCARCGGPKRHPSTASINCTACGDMVCGKHAVADPDRGGWVCTRCEKRQGQR